MNTNAGDGLFCYPNRDIIQKIVLLAWQPDYEEPFFHRRPIMNKIYLN